MARPKLINMRRVFLRFALLVILGCSMPWCYVHGQQTETDLEEVEEIETRAEAGEASAQYNLGLHYIRGVGVEKDLVEAVKWFRKAAEQNLAPAEFSLGLSCEKGDGQPRDRVEAVKWYRKAAEQNYAAAQFNLGCCYANGEGVTKDKVESYKWWSLAAGQGFNKAWSNVTIIEGRMTRAQIAEGQKRARDFEPQVAPTKGSDHPEVDLKRP